MEELKIKLDYSNGPLWKDKYNFETGELSTGIAVIDNDEVINNLSEEALTEYTSMFYFDENGNFKQDEKIYNEKREKIKNLINAIIDRAITLNDGSYVVINEESDF